MPARASTRSASTSTSCKPEAPGNVKLALFPLLLPPVNLVLRGFGADAWAGGPAATRSRSVWGFLCGLSIVRRDFHVHRMGCSHD